MGSKTQLAFLSNYKMQPDACKYVGAMVKVILKQGFDSSS